MFVWIGYPEWLRLRTYGSSSGGLKPAGVGLGGAARIWCRYCHFLIVIVSFAVPVCSSDLKNCLSFCSLEDSSTDTHQYPCQLSEVAPFAATDVQGSENY